MNAWDIVKVLGIFISTLIGAIGFLYRDVRH